VEHTAGLDAFGVVELLLTTDENPILSPDPSIS